MSYSKPVNPKRKRRVYATKEPPFPVPIATVANEPAPSNRCFYYTGYLEGDHVVVKHSGDIDYLSKMGFFGKGVLSRSRPDFNRRFRVANIPDEYGNIRQTHVTSRRSYLRRLHWSSKQEDSCEEYDSSQEVEEETVHVSPVEDNQRLRRNECDVERSTGLLGHHDEDAMSEGSNDAVVSQNPGNVLERIEDREVKVDNWESTEEDPDFWGGNVSNSVIHKTEEDPDFWSGDASNTAVHTTSSWSSWTEEDSGEYRSSPWLKDTESGLKTDTGIDSEAKMLQKENSVLFVGVKRKRDEMDEIQRLDNSSAKVNIPSPKRERCDLQTLQSEKLHKRAGGINEYEQQKERDVCNKTGQNNVSDSTKDSVHTTHNRDQHDIGTLDIQKNEETKREVPKKYDSRSLRDKDEGTLFVVDDSDSDSEMKERKYSELPWKPVMKIDPYLVKEDLHLMFEEAFFLAYGLGCLIVQNKEKDKLSLENMWRIFCERRLSFLPNYIAYHYYRSKGWVPKSGLKFGSDLIIYKEGPAFYHSSYSVIVKMVDMETLQECKDFPQRNLDWTSLSGLNRVTEHVAKELLFCYVLKPATLSSQDLLSPGCISHFKVKEHMVSRWVSSQERENKQTEDMP